LAVLDRPDRRQVAWVLGLHQKAMRLADRLPENAKHIVPGIVVAAATAFTAYVITQLFGALFTMAFSRNLTIPVVAVALLLGLALNRHLATPRYRPGLVFSAGTMLKVLVALLGLRISLSDVSQLGLPLAISVIMCMTLTLAVAIGAARALGLPSCTGALMGAANAVCGAAATLATSAALPADRDRTASVLLTVVLASTVSTIAMLTFPLLAGTIGLSPLQSGVLIGLSIQDVAQVVGAGLALPPEAAAAAVTVKMFRVFMLLPVVLAIAWLWRGQTTLPDTKVPLVPRFAIGFLILCVINSSLQALPGPSAVYMPLRSAVIDMTNAGLAVSIAALGIGTSMPTLWGLGVRPIAVFLLAAVTILAGALGSVLILVP